MAFGVELLEEARILLARFCAPSNSDEAWQAVQAIKRQVTTSPVEGVLVDVNGIEYKATAAEVRSFATEFASFLGRRRLAFVSSSGTHFGMAQMIALQADARGAQVEVFKDDGAALDWLQSPDLK